jgi:hypothetical protein
VKSMTFSASDTAGRPSVTAFAGRRVDARSARQIRFPPQNVRMVEEGIRECLRKAVCVLVCSAACGSDLLALGIAGDLGIRRRVLLPFDRARFRETSVVDRPGNWGEIYDRVLDEVQHQRDLVVLDYEQTDPAAYARTNAAIVDEALRISREQNKLAQALVVWDGKSRGSDDLTAHFLDDARGKGMPILEVLTLMP